MRLKREMIPAILVLLLIYFIACVTAIRRKLNVLTERGEDSQNENEILVFIGMNNGNIIIWKNFSEISEHQSIIN